MSVCLRVRCRALDGVVVHVFHVEHIATDAFSRGSLCLDVGIEETQEARRAGLVENDLKPMCVRCGASFASGCPGKRVLESYSRRAVVGLGLTPSRRGFRRPVGFCLELTTELYRLVIELAVCEATASTVWRWLHEDALKPWQQQCWIYQRDRQFAANAGRVLDLYERVFEGKRLWPNEYVICADERGRRRCLLQVMGHFDPELAAARDPLCYLGVDPSYGSF